MAIREFIERCDAFCAAHGKSRGWLSKQLFQDTNRLNDLAGGESDVGVMRLQRAEADLAELGRAQEERAAAA